MTREVELIDGRARIRSRSAAPEIVQEPPCLRVGARRFVQYLACPAVPQFMTVGLTLEPPMNLRDSAPAVPENGKRAEVEDCRRHGDARRGSRLRGDRHGHAAVVRGERRHGARCESCRRRAPRLSRAIVLYASPSPSPTARRPSGRHPCSWARRAAAPLAGQLDAGVRTPDPRPDRARTLWRLLRLAPRSRAAFVVSGVPTPPPFGSQRRHVGAIQVVSELVGRVDRAPGRTCSSTPTSPPDRLRPFRAR